MSPGNRIVERQDQLVQNMAFDQLAALEVYAKTRSFDPGDKLRELGHHYSDMLLVVYGLLRVSFDPATETAEIDRDGGPIGEFGFLYGMAATSTVEALSPVKALVIDDAALSDIENRNPELSVALMRYLASTADDRSHIGIVDFDSRVNTTDASSITTLLCREEHTLMEAQRLRYTVYCAELGRTSPYADLQKKIIQDPLDEFGYTFLAKKNGEYIGTLRTNFAVEGSLGILTRLYGMEASAFYPGECAICTKFIISRSARGGNAAMSLIAGVADFALRRGMKECFIDCVPGLLHYYQAMGFKVTGDEFFHRENGPSIPLKVDLKKYGKSLCAGDSFMNLARMYVKAKYYKLRRQVRESLALAGSD